MKIKKGDNVIVITGKDKGKTGKVLEVYPKDERVLVDGVNIIARHTKPKSAQDKGGIIKKSAPVHVSNVMIFENGKVTKIAHRIIDGKKVRISKQSGESLDKAFVKAVRKEAKANKEQKPAKETKKDVKAEKPAASKEQKVKKVAEKKTASTVRKTVAKSGK